MAVTSVEPAPAVPMYGGDMSKPFFTLLLLSRVRLLTGPLP